MGCAHAQIKTMHITTEEDRPNCAQLRRDAGFSHRGRGAPLSAPDTSTVKASVLCTPLSEAIGEGRGCSCRGPEEGVAPGRHQPAEIHEPSEKRLGLPHGELARA